MLRTSLVFFLATTMVASASPVDSFAGEWAYKHMRKEKVQPGLLAPNSFT
jgi:hypothetical protein